MRKILYFLTLAVVLFSCAGTVSQQDYTAEIAKFQNDLNEGYRNPKESPLRGENLKNFKQHPFFPVNKKYRVNTKLIKTENAEYFDFPTSSGKTKRYKEYGKIYFQLDGKNLALSVYQREGAEKIKGYEDHLFLPFKDLTSGKETYGGGKYIDLTIPKTGRLIVDFNKSYHPYCAYNAHDYSCPIVPAENNLAVEIRAGVMYEDIYFEH